MSAPPNHLVRAVLGEFIAVEEQHEFIENVDSIDMKSNALRGDIGDEAVTRGNANPELDSGELPQAMTGGAAPFIKIKRAHDARLQVCGRAWRLATAPLSENTYRGALAATLTPVLKFFPHLPEIGAAVSADQKAAAVTTLAMSTASAGFSGWTTRCVAHCLGSHEFTFLTP